MASERGVRGQRIHAVIARKLCEAYASNGGNNFREHRNPNAAVQWMEMALEEVGLSALIREADKYTGIRSRGLEDGYTLNDLTKACKAIARETP